jgi:two-component system sensor histidine kinase KdpD
MRRADPAPAGGRSRAARSVAAVRPRERVEVTGEISAVRTVTRGAAPAYLCVLDDGTGEIDLLFLGRREVPGLGVGARCRAEGTARVEGGRLVVWNPLYWLGDQSGWPEAALPAGAPAGSAAGPGREQATAPPAPAEAGGVPASAGAVREEPVDEGALVEPAGHFRIYLGVAAGVGKTVAMLDEGQRRRERGTDVVTALVETHGRKVTAERAEGLEVVPRRRVEHRGAVLEEMDLEAVLRRKPKVALVDELAHTNVPGSGRNEKRWQDVLELLEAGIDVITTVNIQHLESIADAVERISHVPVRERVPDWVVRRADQIELVDSSPEQLRRRMLHGNIYPPEQVPNALAHFFRADNLSALRELALRFMADETEEELLEHLLAARAETVWETAERMAVGVTAAPGTAAVVRRAARMAARMKADLHAVHVTTRDAALRGRDELAAVRRVASDVGASWHEVEGADPVEALVEFARRHQITQLVIGASQRSRWRELAGGGSIVQRMSRRAAGAGVDLHIIARRGTEPAGEGRYAATGAGGDSAPRSPHPE